MLYNFQAEDKINFYKAFHGATHHNISLPSSPAKTHVISEYYTKQKYEINLGVLNDTNNKAGKQSEMSIVHS